MDVVRAFVLGDISGHPIPCAKCGWPMPKDTWAYRASSYDAPCCSPFCVNGKGPTRQQLKEQPTPNAHPATGDESW